MSHSDEMREIRDQLKRLGEEVNLINATKLGERIDVSSVNDALAMIARIENEAVRSTPSPLH